MYMKPVLIAATMMSAITFSSGDVLAESLVLDVLIVPADTQIVSRNMMSYDPVTRAIALGLTPEWLDAKIDLALAQAERCPTGAADIGDPISCIGTTMGRPAS